MAASPIFAAAGKLSLFLLAYGPLSLARHAYYFYIIHLKGRILISCPTSPACRRGRSSTFELEHPLDLSLPTQSIPNMSCDLDYDSKSDTDSQFEHPRMPTILGKGFSFPAVIFELSSYNLSI